MVVSQAAPPKSQEKTEGSSDFASSLGHSNRIVSGQVAAQRLMRAGGLFGASLGEPRIHEYTNTRIHVEVQEVVYRKLWLLSAPGYLAHIIY